MNTPNEERQASAGQVERPVRPLVDKLRDYAQGIDLGAAGIGWIPDQALLREAADEIERLAGVVKKANDQAEHFERLLYLTNEDAGRYAFAKTLEGQVVTMETLKSRGAEALDQAIDDAMMEDADAQSEAGYGPNVI